jgi:predicted ArsR family transcriptional regulator
MATTKAVLDLGRKLAAIMRRDGPRTIAQLAAEMHLSGERVRTALHAMQDRGEVHKTMVNGSQRWCAADTVEQREQEPLESAATSALGRRRLIQRDDDDDEPGPSWLV